MKKLAIAIITVLSIMSCGDDEITYPTTYNYSDSVEVSTATITADESGNIIEVDKLHTIDGAGVSLFELFNSDEMFSGKVSSITLDSEVELTIDFGMDTPAGQFLTVPYSGDSLAQLGLKVIDDEIVTSICHSLAFIDGVFLDKFSTYCFDDNAALVSQKKFAEDNMNAGDTLAIMIINHIYK